MLTPDPCSGSLRRRDRARDISSAKWFKLLFIIIFYIIYFVLFFLALARWLTMSEKWEGQKMTRMNFDRLSLHEPLQFCGSRLVRMKGYEERPEIHGPAEAARFLHDHIEQEMDREIFGVLCITPGGQINHSEILTVGDVDTTLADARAVFRAAILSNSAGVILFHTHPTTPLNGPSEQDVMTTKNLVIAGRMMGITIVDHIVLNDDGWWSFNIAAEGGDMVDWCCNWLKEREE